MVYFFSMIFQHLKYAVHIQNVMETDQQNVKGTKHQNVMGTDQQNVKGPNHQNVMGTYNQNWYVFIYFDF